MKKIAFWTIMLLINLVIAYRYLYLCVLPNEITVTEMVHRYKNYVVTEKYEYNDNYFIRIKNPYKLIDLIHKPLKIPSGVYYNYSVGDTIGKHKQIYFK